MSKPSSFKARLSVEFLEDRTTPTFLPNPSGPVINVNGVNVRTGGVSVAAGDLLVDQFSFFGLAENEYVTGSGPGTNSLVQIWSRTGTLEGQFSPFPGFRGGINVAVGDVIGDARNEIVVAMASGPPVVAVFNPNGEVLSYFALNGNTTFTGGLNVAVGNVMSGISAGGFSGGAVSGQFKQEIIIGLSSQVPAVFVTDGSGNIASTFMAFDPSFKIGVNVAAANLDATRSPGYVVGSGLEDTNAYDEIVVGAASFLPGVSVWKIAADGSASRTQLFFAFDPSVPGNLIRGQGGVTVAAGPTDTTIGGEIYTSLIGTSRIRVFNGATGGFQGENSVYPGSYSGVINMVVAYLTPGGYDPSDDDTAGGFTFDFETQDLGVVAGDGPFNQQPRYFIGLPFSAATLNGP